MTLSYLRAAREEFLERIDAVKNAVLGRRTLPETEPRLRSKREGSPLWSEQGFRALGETMSESLVVADTDDRIVYTNARFSELFGYPAGQVLGRSVRDLVDPTASARYAAHVARRHRGETDRLDLTLLRAEKKPFHGYVSVRPHHDSDGRFAGTFISIAEAVKPQSSGEIRIESEARLREIVEHGSNLLYARTPDHVLTYVSPQAKSFFGCAPEEELTSWRRFVSDHPANRAALEHAQRASDTGKPPHAYDLELRRPDGHVIWVEVNETPVVEDGRTVTIVGALTDITARRRMEDLLRVELELAVSLAKVRTAHEAYRHALAAALKVDEVDAGGVYALEGESGDLALVRHRGFSEAFAASVARLPASTHQATLVRRTSGRGLEAEDPEARKEGLRATRMFPIRHEGRLLACLKLASRHADAFSTVAVGSIRTIALQLGSALSRFETQTSLGKSESTLRSLVSSAPAGIGLVRDRAFQWVNDHMVRWTGYPIRELLGQSARMLYMDDEEFARVGMDMLNQIERTGLGSVETRWKRRDGGLIDVLLSAAALDRNDLATGMVFTAWDVTERNRTEEERRHLESQVQQAQKLESLGMLAGGIAHDFNNILHAILGHASMAGTCLNDTGQAESHLDAIERAASRAGELCRQMLAYSGRGSFVIKRFHLGEIVRDLASMLDVSLSKNTELCVDVEGDTKPIEADASQMRQVVLNLITNASEAIGTRKGLVRATVSTADYGEGRLQTEFWQAGLAPGTYVALTVEDNGCGMDDETRERIFEPFFTTKFTGRGLGLAALQGIVRGHGGAIRVASELGRGTTVTVLIPPASGKARPRPLVERRASPAKVDGTILLADDEPRVREIGALMLESAGFDVVAVDDGHAAVEEFRRRPDEILCVILDLTMPVMDGEDAFRELRKIRSDVPVILCSGYSAQELQHRFDGDQPEGFLEKPFKADALLDLVTKIASARA